MSEIGTSTAGGNAVKKGDHRAMVRSANTMLSVQQLLSANREGQEGEGLDRVNVVKSLRADLITPIEKTIISKSEQTVREFSMSSLLASAPDSKTTPAVSTTYAQTEDTKSRAISALTALYLLSPVSSASTGSTFVPTYQIEALKNYLTTSLRSSLPALARALATLPTLDRTLLEISARCQNIVALEALLDSIKPPPHILLEDARITAPPNFLQPLLQSLDTSSLPSFFWRTLASNLSPRVQEIVRGGGVSARTLRSNKDRIRDAIRTCVNRGSQLPVNVISRSRDGKTQAVGNWEREAAVMVGAIVGVLGR